MAASTAGEAGAGAESEDSVSVNDSEHNLVQKAYIYITEGTYPGGATANEKRVIRKKAKKFAVRNGELVYKKVIRGRKLLQLRRLQSRMHFTQCCALKILVHYYNKTFYDSVTSSVFVILSQLLR